MALTGSEVQALNVQIKSYQQTSSELFNSELLAQLHLQRMLHESENKPKAIAIKGFASNRSMMSFPNPLQMIFDAIFNKYKGKLDSGLDEVVQNAEITVTMLEGSAKGNHDNSVNINIRVAATILDDYSWLLKYFIDKPNGSVSQDDKIKLHEAHDKIDAELAKLMRLQYKNAITILSYHSYQRIEEINEAGCCLGICNFFHKPRINRIKSIASWLTSIAKNSEANHHVLIGAAMLIYKRLDKISNEDDKLLMQLQLQNIFRIENTAIDKQAMKPFLLDFNRWASQHSELTNLEDFYKHSPIEIRSSMTTPLIV